MSTSSCDRRNSLETHCPKNNSDGAEAMSDVSTFHTRTQERKCPSAVFSPAFIVSIIVTLRSDTTTPMDANYRQTRKKVCLSCLASSTRRPTCTITVTTRTDVNKPITCLPHQWRNWRKHAAATVTAADQQCSGKLGQLSQQSIDNACSAWLTDRLAIHHGTQRSVSVWHTVLCLAGKKVTRHFRSKTFQTQHFYARKQNASRVFAIVWASVRPSVCLSHSWSVLKRCKLGSRNLHYGLSQGL